MKKLTALMMAAMVVVLIGGLAHSGQEVVEAATSGSSAFDINGGDPVTVGFTYDYEFRILNASTETEATESVTLSQISGYPACEAIQLQTIPICATEANQNPGDFVPVGPHTGVAGTACEGITFTVAVLPGGLWSFEPAAPVVLGPADGSGDPEGCIIEGNVQIVAAPDDAAPNIAGIQAFQLARAVGTTDETGTIFLGQGSALLTVVQIETPTPTPTLTPVPPTLTPVPPTSTPVPPTATVPAPPPPATSVPTTVPTQPPPARIVPPRTGEAGLR